MTTSNASTPNLRDFLAVLEAAGKLKRVTKEVDPSWEPAALAKWMYQAVPEADRVGLLFENVRGSELPLAVGALGASAQTVALALGTTPERINERIVNALLHKHAPVVVADAPVQERVLLGADADLGRLPIPVWTPGKDIGPYITQNVVTRNADTGVQNVAVYRTQVLGAREVIINLSPGGRHGTMNWQSWKAKGQRAPIAWVIGPEPAVTIASVGNLPFGSDEIEFAGGIAGAPIELVRCKTIDLLVPANAQMIIEGVITDRLHAEGPFGEFAGFMGDVAERPVVEITAITMRHDAIFYGFTSQMPPSESTIVQSLTNSGVWLKVLREDLSEKSVIDIAIDKTFGGLLGHAYVAVNARLPLDAKRIGRLIAALAPVKMVTLVDGDVDVRDPLHIEWAMNSCFLPARDTDIITDTFSVVAIDPSLRNADGSVSRGSKIVFDATQKHAAGKFSLPDQAIMDRAHESWREIGLPEFAIPPRVRSRIARA